jgi:two-component system sensor histidine kinase KdpD
MYLFDRCRAIVGSGDDTIDRQTSTYLTKLGWQVACVDSWGELRRLLDDETGVIVVGFNLTGAPRPDRVDELMRVGEKISVVLITADVEQYKLIYETVGIRDRVYALPSRNLVGAMEIVLASITRSARCSDCAEIPHGQIDIALGRRLDLFDSLSDALRMVTTEASDFDRLLERFLGLLLKTVGAERGSIMLVERGDSLVVRAATTPAILGAVKSLDDDSVSSTAARENRTILIDDIVEHPLEGVDFNPHGGYKTQTLLTIPISFQEEVVGVINVTDKLSRRVFAEQDQTIVQMFAGVVVSALLGKEARLQRDRLQVANEDLTRLEALKERLTHMIVHDLKGPAGEIMGNLNMLADFVTDTFGKELLEDSIAATDELFRMIVNILDVSKMEEGLFTVSKRETELTELLESAADKVRPLARREDKLIKTSLPPSPYVVMADTDIVARVVWNLLSNANNHTQVGGEILLSCEDAGESVVIKVVDTGAGIAEENLDRIFERFYQGLGEKRQYSSGLGLTFVKMAVEAHGGAVGVESVVGKGSTFTLTLPKR